MVNEVFGKSEQNEQRTNIHQYIVLNHVCGKEKVFPQGIERRANGQIKGNQTSPEPYRICQKVLLVRTGSGSERAHKQRIHPAHEKNPPNEGWFRVPVEKSYG
jgi:hypothetical protein